MPRATYLYSFDVPPERRTAFAEWARASGLPFWLSRPGLLSYRTYRVNAGSAASLSVAEFESGETLGRRLDSQDWIKHPGRIPLVRHQLPRLDPRPRHHG
jgi:hypothetical protein